MSQKQRNTESHQKGKEAEDKIEGALRLIIARNSLPIIKTYHRAIKTRELDAEHADFLIFLNNLIAIPLQVKNSRQSVDKHYTKYPYILAIAAGDAETPEGLARFIEKLIIKILKKIASDPLKPINPLTLHE